MQYKYTCIQSVCIYDLYFVGVDKIHRFKPGKNCFHWSPQKSGFIDTSSIHLLFKKIQVALLLPVCLQFKLAGDLLFHQSAAEMEFYTKVKT